VTLGDGNLTVGKVSGTTLFAGVISGAGGVIKNGTSTQVLSGNNTYTGPTIISSGTLEVSGSINGSNNPGGNAIQVDQTGTLLLSGGSEILNNGARLDLNGGTLALSGSSIAETVGALDLSVTSTLDFGAGSGNQLVFDGGLFSHTAGTALNIIGWSGAAETLGSPGTDRLIFTGDTIAYNAFINSFGQNEITFNGVSGYHAIQFGNDTEFEIVAVPEPFSTALFTTIGLVVLAGYRGRRRVTGIIASGDRAEVRR
jgi:autotransporter-associated beta strand protein